jgi:EAL domain-containing protein (putative c-di-GMP-specific phosphodiesterase class I)
MEPDRLELELTEGVAMANPQHGVLLMERLREQGICMAVDDFGTGYSSLSYLKKFRVHKLKIDQSFVRDITIDPEDKAIVGAIISMARSLGIQTIAEGVETQEQLNSLVALGCDQVQGYFHCKPLPAADFFRFALAHGQRQRHALTAIE